MNLPPNLLEHKTLMIGLLLIARRVAKALDLDPEAPVAEICRAAGANRTSVYEQAERIVARVQELADAGPGRPPSPEQAGDEENVAFLTLALRVLSYLLDHPGSVVAQRRRTFYSPAFQRFVLAEHDRWQGTQEAFAEAVRVPLDTLRDWLRRDNAGSLAEPEPKQLPAIPVDASELVKEIAKEWQRWQGPKRPFVRHAASKLRVSPNQVVRVLRILGVISPRRRRGFRYRGSTHDLAPGTLLVTDGKAVDVQLTGSGTRLRFNWQGIVDQTTACDTAVVVTDEECAAGVSDAYERSVDTLGGVAPVALLHDNKPCYEDAELKQELEDSGTMMIPATPSRPENKAVLEGAFGLFEQRVGTIHLDDTSVESLIRSAVKEAVRAYTGATNSVPRAELDGQSRLQVLHDSCPSFEQQQRDLDFLANLKAEHDNPRRWHRTPDPTCLELLDAVFERLGLLDKDPSRSLRRYLAATYEPAAIRRAAAVCAAKLERGAVDHHRLDRYLVAVIGNQQHELDLERAADELLLLCKLQNESWTSHQERDYELLVSEHDDPEDLALALVENAAHGGIPVQAVFWKDKLLAHLRHVPHLAAAVTRHLTRLYEADPQRRLTLIDLVTAQECGLS